MFLFLQWCVLVLIGLINNIHFIHAYNQVDEASYMANFGHIIANSYSHPLPSQLLTSTCKTNVGISGVTRTLGGGTISATQAQSVCSIDSTCIIPAGTTLLMDNSLVVGALINRGTIQWTDSTQSSQHQWLCAGYVVTEGGTFTLDLQNNAKNAYLYIKNNGATHPILRSRSFGGSDGARIRILGSPLIRTWSLLSRPITIGSSTITLMHDINSMGWKIGDRIIIAPTTVGSSGRAEAYRIAGINANTITLGQLTSSATATTQQSFKSNTSYIDSASAWTTIMAAEVIHMSRNIIITGDDFQHRGCRTDITNPADDCKCMPNMGRTQCTLGLHTVLVGTGGLLQLQYTRVEKCGQRGILGKYCVHTHLSAQCPDCIIRGNSIEYGHQRGIVIHGTHLSTIEHNVMSDVRGANIYIEDGNEMYNRILYNIALCPWPLSDPYLQGCTIPGTDNDQSDTTINQAGIWALSFSNDIIGNRMINSYNGMLYQAQGYEKGRDETQGQICPNNQQIGRLEGNTFHGHGRFGTYILSSIYPKAVTQVRTLNNNGLLPDNDFSACAAATSDGNDRGMMVSFYRNIDYGNTFVGQYNMGDIQYVDHTSIECNNLIYWKETKNPVDGCSSYYLNGYFEGSSSVPGTVALPSGHGTVVLENIVLAGMIILESSHHCQEGWTGVLCMPTYVFHKVRAPVKDVRISYAWGKNNGAMYTLSPDDPTNAGGNLFPIGYVSLANPFWSYLLALDGGRTCFTSSSVASSLGEDVNAFTTRYGRGILCKRPLRRLEIWTPKLTTSMNPPNLRLELIQNNIMISYVIVPFFQISGGELGKQGYAITVIPGTTHSYRLMREDKGPIDNNWVIEFSDTIFGNRWPRDEILLTVVGRSCPSPVHSLHDRRFIWYDSDNHPFQAGRGACTSQPDMPAKNCQNLVPAPIGTACPEKCPGGCNNGYCDCGRGVCQCNAGFYGPNCAQDVCASSFVCNPSYGRCTARYLGGTLPPVENMCACKQNIFGPYCDIDPCAGQTCSGHGKCKVLSQTSIACICDAGWNGGACSLPCSGSSCEPACFSGFQYYTDTNLETNIYDRQYSEDAETCGQQCTADGTRCVAALFYNGNYCGKMSALSGTRTSFTGRILLQRCSTTSTPPPAAGYGSNPGTPNIPVVINPPPPVTQPPVIVTQPPVIATQPPVIATQPPPVISTPPPPVTITNPPPSTSASTASITFNAYDDTYTISGVINGDRVTLSLACVDTKVRLTSIQFMIAFSSTVPMTDISQPGCTTTGFASTLSCSMTYKPLPLYLYVMWNIQGVPYRMQHPLPQAEKKTGTSPFVTLQFSTSTTVATTPPTQAPVPVTQAPVPVTQAPVPVTQPPPVPVTQAPPIPSGSNVARIPFTAYDSSYTLTGTLNSACTSVTLSLTSSSKTLTSVIFMVAYSTSIPMNDISQPGCQTSGSSSTLSCTVTVPYQRIPLYIYVMWNVIGVPYRMQQPLPQAGVSPFLPGMNLVCTGGAAGTQDDDDDDEDTATLPPPVTDSGVCRDCSVVETGWDYMGMDLGKKPIAANHHSECCSICSNTKGCHAYSYYDGYCYLKSTSAGRVRRIGSTSSTICTASEQIGYQDTSITYDVTIASCLNDNTCQQIHGKLSQCIRSREKGATGYCHCRKDAVISGSGQCIRASPCGVCPSIPDCPIGRYPVVKKAASPDYGRCCHQYKCERMGGPAAAGIQMLPEDEMFEDESTITETSSSRMKSMMIPIAIIASIILFAVLGVLTWSKYRKHQSPFSFKFQLHRDQHDDQEQGNVPITHFDTSNTSSSEFPQGALSPSPIHHFSLSSLTTSTSNSSISDSYVPASPATLWNMSRMQRSDSTDVTSDTNLTSIPEFPQGHFSISRRHQKSRAASPEPNPAPAPDEESPESHNNE